jgi:hypothetical protein
MEFCSDQNSASLSNREKYLCLLPLEGSKQRRQYETRYKLDDDISIVTIPPLLDLNRIYASDEVRRGKTTRSMSSFTTEWSTSTTQISNTTTLREAKKQQKRRFLLLLEKKDPAVYHDAQVVIHDCEKKKKRGEVESVVESLKAPLKEVVGPRYWNEARSYSKKAMNSKKMELPRNYRTEEEVLSFSMAELTFLHDGRRSLVSPVHIDLKSTDSSNDQEETIRKKRLWMIICVFMKSLMRTDEKLYLQAKDLVVECIRRHRMGEDGYNSLSSSIQRRLKKEIGNDHWKRAESYVAKFLLSNTVPPRDTDDPSVSATQQNFRKRAHDLRPFSGGKKRQRFYDI